MAETKRNVNYNHQVVNGVVFPDFIDQEAYDKAATLVPLQDGDVFISTYPKSGTTWTQKIVRLVVHGPIPEGEKLTSVVPWHEAYATTIKDLEAPRLFKSHLDWPMTYKAEGKAVRYINVARNGKDVAVSMFYHTKGWKSFGFDGDWDDWVEMFLAGEVEFGLWFDHVQSWWEARGRPDVLILFYEEMLADPAAAVRAIAAHLDVSLTDERVAEIVKECSFATMKKDPQSNYSICKSEFRTAGAQNFMRKGQVGDWRTHFTQEQADRFDRRYDELLAACPGLKFTFVQD